MTVDHEARRVGPLALRRRDNLGAALICAPRSVPIPEAPARQFLVRYGIRPFLLATDVAAATFAAIGTDHVNARGASRLLLALFVVLLLMFNTSAGLYRSRLTLSVLADLPRLLGRCLAAYAIVGIVALTAEPTVGRRLALTAAVYLPVALLLRLGCHTLVRAARRRGLVAHPTLILGAGLIGGRFAELMLARPEFGLKPVGFLDDDPLLAQSRRPVPLLGGGSALARVIAEFGVRDVVVAFSNLRESKMVEIIRTCDRMECEIFVVPRLFELAVTRSRDAETLWGLPLVRLPRAPFRSLRWPVKRAFDVAVSGIALLALAPVFAACALAVRLEGGSGVLFGQQRVGMDGRLFRLLKFRSLRPRDDAESATRWTIDDGCLGPVGRFLRRTSLDELPQLCNVFRGDMSLVGPRPERPHFVSRFNTTYAGYPARHRVPSGVTGWAQVHGLRGDTSIADRARFDNYYIENWSLWLDVSVLLRTVAAVVRGQGR